MYFSPTAAQTALRLAHCSGLGELLIVRWREVAGGTVDPITRAVVGGTRVDREGTLSGFGREEPARTVTRTFAEVQTGDLIFDLPPDPAITLPDGSTVSLASVQPWNPRFTWGGRDYQQASLGSALSAAWDARAGGVSLGQTLLLRPVT
jgi:hypothetical protein